MVVKGIHLLYDGIFVLPKPLIVYSKYFGENYECALKPLLISMDEGNILVDTGIGELPSKLKRYHVVKRRPDELERSLHEHGLEPDDISLVVCTHLHFDHTGNNHLFENAKFIVQKDELRFAYAPDRYQKGAYNPGNLDVDFEPIKGDKEVVEDVTVIRTPGHSPGHQSVVLETAEERIVYCGDAAIIEENLSKRNIPGVLWCSYEALESIDRLRAIRDATFIYSHDNSQLDFDWPK